MAGHGLRFLALEAGCSLEAATFLGGLAVGVVSVTVNNVRRKRAASQITLESVKSQLEANK